MEGAEEQRQQYLRQMECQKQNDIAKTSKRCQIAFVKEEHSLQLDSAVSAGTFAGRQKERGGQEMKRKERKFGYSQKIQEEKMLKKAHLRSKEEKRDKNKRVQEEMCCLQKRCLLRQEYQEHQKGHLS